MAMRRRSSRGWTSSLRRQNRKMGTQGFIACGGPMRFAPELAVPGRVGPVASPWAAGERLVTACRKSASSSRDNQGQSSSRGSPERRHAFANDKNVLKETFAKRSCRGDRGYAGRRHGWCPPDSGVYNEATGRESMSRFLRCTKAWPEHRRPSRTAFTLLQLKEDRARRSADHFDRFSFEAAVRWRTARQ